MTRLRRVVLAVLAFIRALLRPPAPGPAAPDCRALLRGTRSWGRGAPYPGQVIGYLRDGRPVRLIAGGAGITVTATQSGSTANGIQLTVKVLTSAAVAASQTGATLTATAGSASFTTTTAGSVVYGAFSSANEDTFTATAASTIIAQHQDATNGAGYSSWRSTAATGTPGAATLGVTGGTFGTNGSTYAAAEILAAGTIAEDGSSPATASTNAATAVTTASFTPPGSSLLVAIASCDGAGSGLNVTITDSSGLTWHKLAFLAGTSFMGAGVWIADVPSATLAVATTSLPAAATGVAYSQTLAATGGTAPYTWSVSSGSLPSWASLNSSTGAITGTPSSGQAGTTFTVEVTDNVSATATKSLTINVNAPVTLVGSVGTATSTSGSVTGAYGQTPTAGSVLVAAVAAGSTTAETSNISSSTTGWARLTAGSVGNNASGTDKAIVDYWWKAAAGGDAVPVFTQTLGATAAMTCHIYELAGANTTSPLDDASGTFLSGSSTGSVVFSETSAALQSYGEFAISLMCQQRATTGNWTWTETGSGWTSQGKLPAATSTLAVQSNSRASAGPAAVTDAGSFSTHSTALGAGLIVTIIGAQVTSSGVSEPFTEAGAGSDALAITQPTALTEVGSGSDALALTQPTALSAAGAGADTLTVSIPVALGEAGAGADALTVTVVTPVALGEAGSGADALSLVVPVALSESGAGADALSVVAVMPVALAEAGAGADTLALTQPTALAEAGTGSDQLALAAGVALAETGAGADAFTAAIPTVLAEAGSGADALALTQPTALADAGAGSDSLGVMPGLSEAGAGSDALSVTAASPVALSDAGTGSEALSLSAGVALGEAGSAADALALSQPTALAVAGSGSDALALAQPTALTEAGAGADSLAVTAASPVALAEAGSGADALAVTQPTALAVAGAGSDQLALTQPTALSEAGAGTDQLAIAIPVALTEAGAGTDQLVLADLVALAEAGSGADALSVSVAGGPVVITDTETCTASESEFAFVSGADAGSAADGAEVIVVRDTDRCVMAERELTRWPHDTDSCHATEAGGPSGPVNGGTETCTAADGRERITLASSDACAADDEGPDIEIYTYVPPFRTGPGGGWYKVAWGTTEVLRTARVDGTVLRFARELNRARELRFVSDADVCTASESSRRVTGVTVSVVPALEVSVQVVPITRM